MEKYIKTTDINTINQMNADYAMAKNDGYTSAWREPTLRHGYYYLLLDEISDPYFQDAELVDEIPPEHEWHEPDMAIQVIMSYEDNLRIIMEAPELVLYIKENDIDTIIGNNFVYIYVNYILEEHKEILEQFNATINERSI